MYDLLFVIVVIFVFFIVVFFVFVVSIFIFFGIIIHYCDMIIIIGLTRRVNGIIIVIVGRDIVAIMNFGAHSITMGQFMNPVDDIMGHRKLFLCELIVEMSSG